jgi:hypothetical protein
MFESHRKFKTCVLCGRYDLTKEHIFGAKFAAYLNVAHNWTAIATPDGLAALFDKYEVKGSSPITNIAPQLLCGKCNKERLSGLMNDSLPYLKDLSSGKSISIPPEGIRTIKRYFERIALIVDVCTSNEQLKSSYKETREHKLAAKYRKELPTIKMAEREAWLAGELLAHTAIFLGHHIGVLGLNPEVNISHYRVGQAGIDVHPAKRVSMVIKELAVQIDIGMGQEELPTSFTSIDKITSWPTTPKVTYDDYYSLRVQDQNTHLRRLVLQNPRLVAQIEKVSREKGTFTIPDNLM